MFVNMYICKSDGEIVVHLGVKIHGLVPLRLFGKNIMLTETTFCEGIVTSYNKQLSGTVLLVMPNKFYSVVIKYIVMFPPAKE